MRDMNKCIIKKENVKNNIKMNSEIMKSDEFDMIRIQIEKTMKKEIKGINILYQATKDGFDNSHLNVGRSETNVL